MEQWEEDEEPIPPDELPEGHPDRPQPPIDFSKNVNIINASVGDPHDILVRIRIFGSVPHTNGSGSNSGSDSFLLIFILSLKNLIFC